MSSKENKKIAPKCRFGNL